MAGGLTAQPQDNRWWISRHQTGINFSRAIQLEPTFAGANADGLVLSGTPYPANDGTIIGFIINDVDVNSIAQAGCSLLQVGIVGIKYLEEKGITLDPLAIQKLKDDGKITLVGLDGMVDLS